MVSMGGYTLRAASRRLGYSTLLMPDGLQPLAPFVALGVAAKCHNLASGGDVRARQPVAQPAYRRVGRA